MSLDLDWSEEQEMLREMVRGVTGSYAPLTVVREMEDDAIGFPAAFWKQLAELQGGRLELRSDGAGTAFVLELPAARSG